MHLQCWLWKETWKDFFRNDMWGRLLLTFKSNSDGWGWKKMAVRWQKQKIRAPTSSKCIHLGQLGEEITLHAITKLWHHWKEWIRFVWTAYTACQKCCNRVSLEKAAKESKEGVLPSLWRSSSDFWSSSVGWKIFWLIACRTGWEESPKESHGGVTDLSFRVRERKKHSLKALKCLDHKP